ncbi:adult-specific cuticular protein ACP-20-like [Uranotaenia lowii]|uniref:adult-specific cuticular protein ACP-20-like n=1 Tax=Uranotaenia lowii TaxID=190385 RepID=UPI00247A5D39|nr:adult-specific cuticular protein ACP-20-like [Uranotaenia lowii]
MFKLLLAIGCLAAVCSAQFYGGGSDGIGGGSDLGGSSKHEVEHHHHPKYKFEYGVKDDHTGDHKAHWEIRDGDVVKGQYSLHEPDGSERIVEYKADDHNGFEAVVKKVEHGHHHGY